MQVSVRPQLLCFLGDRGGYYRGTNVQDPQIRSWPRAADFSSGLSPPGQRPWHGLHASARAGDHSAQHHCPYWAAGGRGLRGPGSQTRIPVQPSPARSEAWPSPHRRTLWEAVPITSKQGQGGILLTRLPCTSQPGDAGHSLHANATQQVRACQRLHSAAANGQQLLQPPLPSALQLLPPTA